MPKPEKPKQSEAQELAEKDPNRIMMKEMGLKNIRARNIGEFRSEYDAKIDGKGYQIILKKRRDEIEVLAIRHADSEMCDKRITKDIELDRNRKYVDSALNAISEEELKKAAEGIGVKNIEQMNEEKLRAGIKKTLDSEVGRSLEAKLNKIASIFGLKFQTPIEMAFQNILQKIHDRHWKERVGTEFKRAEKILRRAKKRKKKPTVVEVVEKIRDEVVTQAALLALTGVLPVSVAGRSDYGDVRPLIPKQQANIKKATAYNEARKAAEEQERGFRSTRRLRVSAEGQLDWHLEHVAGFAPCAIKDPVIEMMKEHGLTSPALTYSQAAMKVYHFNHKKGQVSFKILPGEIVEGKYVGGTIKYETKTPIVSVVKLPPPFNCTLDIVDTRNGAFKANNLREAIAQLKYAMEHPRKEKRERKFIFSQTPGIAPLDVTDIVNPTEEEEPVKKRFNTVEEIAKRLHVESYKILVWIETGKLKGKKAGDTYKVAEKDFQEFLKKGADAIKEIALPYPIVLSGLIEDPKNSRQTVVEIPTADFSTPLPLNIERYREFLYRPLDKKTKELLVPLLPYAAWYAIGEREEKKAAEAKK